MNNKSKFKQQNRLKHFQYLVVACAITLLVGGSIYLYNNFFVNSNGQDNHLNAYNSTNLNWKKGYIDIAKKYYEEQEKNGDCRYSLYDINNDSIPELFLNSGYRNNLVYTFSNDNVVLVGETYNELYKSIEDIGVVSYGGWGTGIGGAIQYTMDNLTFKEETILTYNAMLPSNPTTYLYREKQLDEETFEEEQLKWTANPLEMYEISETLNEEDFVYPGL